MPSELNDSVSEALPLQREHSNIFRIEAIDSLNSTLGSTTKTFRLTSTLLTCFLLTIFVTAIAFMASAKYRRHESVDGQITPQDGAFRISSQIAGTATEINVKEGDFVREGTVVSTIASTQTLTSGASLSDSLKAVQVAQENTQKLQAEAKFSQITQQISELNQREVGLRADIEKFSELRQILIRRQSLQQQTYAANADLQAKGMISSLALRKEEDLLLAVTQQLAENERASELQRSQQKQIAPQLRRLLAEMALAKTDYASAQESLAEKDFNTSSKLTTKILAPTSGFITALRLHRGDAVSANETLAVIVPSESPDHKAKLQVDLWAPSKAIGFVKKGQLVRIMYDAFPFQTFGISEGIIIDIAGSPVSPKETPSEIITKEQLFKIRVALKQSDIVAYGQHWALTPGMKLSADLILEEQSLMDLLLDPIRASAR